MLPIFVPTSSCATSEIQEIGQLANATSCFQVLNLEKAKIISLPSASIKSSVPTFSVLRGMNHLRHTLLLLLPLIVQGAIFAQNDKQVLGDAVLTPLEIAEGATATYLIRFQNTGNDTAVNLIIRDTLDPRLDFNTFEMVTASHAYQIVRDENSNIIRWFFDDIYLPDFTSGGAQSIGFVMFTVRPKPFLAPGQVILNRACMTFDQTQPICTNEASLWIDDDSSTDDPRLHDRAYQVVPNPNYGHFEVRSQVE